MAPEKKLKRGRVFLFDRDVLLRYIDDLSLSVNQFIEQYAQGKIALNTFRKMLSGKPEIFDYATLNEMSKIFGDLNELSGTLFLNLPVQNENFTGREKIMDILDQGFFSKQTISKPHISKRAVLYGMRGVGKSQIAIEFARRNLSPKKFQVILWATGSNMAASYNGFATYLELKTGKGKSVVEAVKSWMSKLEDLPWLLVVDDMDSASSIARFLPETHSCGHILFITSKKDIHDFELLDIKVDDRIEVPIMPQQTALEFLLNRTGAVSNAKERQAAEDLAEELGYLPLALEQAGAYILQKMAPFEEYLNTYRNCGEPIALLDRSEPINYPTSVAKTWQVSFQAVKEDSPVAAELLHLSAFLHPNSIPVEIIRDGFSELGPTISKAMSGVDRQPLLLREALEPLVLYSLIRYHDQQTYSIHKLVQEVLRHALSEDDALVWIKRTIRVMEFMFPFPKFENWSLCHRLFSNAELAARYVEHYQPSTLLLPARVGIYLCQLGDYPTGESFLKLHLESLEDIFPTESHIISVCLRLLGHYYHVQGKYQESENAFLRCLEILLRNQNASNIDSFELASLYSSLATLYYDMGKSSEETQEFFGKAERRLQTLIKKTDQDDEILFSCLYELGTIYSRYQRHTEATELFERAFQIWNQLGSEDLMQIEDVLYMLGRAYIITEKYSKAESVLIRNLKIQKELYPANHPSLADTFALLGELYTFQEKFSEAEAEFDKSRQIVEKCIELGILQESAPIWDRILEKMSICYMMQGKNEEQETVNRILVDKIDRGISEGILPKLNSHIELRLDSLGKTYLFSQSKYPEAEAIYRRLLRSIGGKSGEVRMRSLDDPETDFDYLKMLGFACMGQKKYAEAEEIFDQGIDVLEEMGVGDDKITIPSSFLFYSEYICFRAYKAVLYKIQGRDSEAAKYEELTLRGIDFYYMLASIEGAAIYKIERQILRIFQIFNLVAPFPEAESLWKRIKSCIKQNGQKKTESQDATLLESDSFSEESGSRPHGKLGRNKPCWCGSGKKYKNCHWSSDKSRTT